MNGQKGIGSIRVYYCGNVSHERRIPAGLSKLQLMADVALEALPCSGKVDPRYILKAFEMGATAVCVLSCPSGHCKSLQGNYRAERRIGLVREMLAEAGLNPESVQIFLPGGPDQEALEAAIDKVTRFVNAEQRLHEKVVA
jgi:F420-non-reducing hydrogenase iron-sulfur subunit